MKSSSLSSPEAARYKEFMQMYPGLHKFMQLVRDKSGAEIVGYVWLRLEEHIDPDRPVPIAYEHMPSFFFIKCKPPLDSNPVEHWLKQHDALVKIKANDQAVTQPDPMKR